MTADTEMDRRAAFERELRRYHTRLRMIRALRAALIGGVAAIGIAAAIAIAGDIPGPAAVASIVLAAIVGSAGAGAWAFIKSPSEMGTAIVLDQAIGRNNCLVTAVECVAGGEALDPVGTLVVREALRQLVAVTPARAFPFEIPRQLLPLLGGLVVVVFASTFARGRLPARTMTPANRAGDAATRPDRTETSPSGRAAEARPGQERQEQEPRRTRVSEPRTEPAPQSSSRSADARPGELAPKEVGRGPAGATGDSASGRSGGTPSAAAATDSAGVRAGGRGGAASTATVVQGAGGVAGGSLLPHRTVESSGATGDVQPYAIRYDAAWKRAQAAVARDRVPAHLRRLVKDYFAAIRPGQR